MKTALAEMERISGPIDSWLQCTPERVAKDVEEYFSSHQQQSPRHNVCGDNIKLIPSLSSTPNARPRSYTNVHTQFHSDDSNDIQVDSGMGTLCTTSSTPAMVTRSSNGFNVAKCNQQQQPLSQIISDKENIPNLKWAANNVEEGDIGQLHYNNELLPTMASNLHEEDTDDKQQSQCQQQMPFLRYYPQSGGGEDDDELLHSRNRTMGTTTTLTPSLSTPKVKQLQMGASYTCYSPETPSRSLINDHSLMLTPPSVLKLKGSDAADSVDAIGPSYIRGGDLEVGGEIEVGNNLSFPPSVGGERRLGGVYTHHLPPSARGSFRHSNSFTSTLVMGGAGTSRHMTAAMGKKRKTSGMLAPVVGGTHHHSLMHTSHGNGTLPRKSISFDGHTFENRYRYQECMEWMNIACGRTRIQAELTNQARNFLHQQNLPSQPLI